MDAILLVALLFSVIGAYLGIDAYLSKEDLHSTRQLLMAQSSLGKTGKELISELCKDVARGAKRREDVVEGIRDEVMTHVQTPLYAVKPVVQMELIHILSDGSKLVSADKSITPEVTGTFGPPTPRRWWRNSRRLEITGKSLMLVGFLALLGFGLSAVDWSALTYQGPKPSIVIGFNTAMPIIICVVIGLIASLIYAHMVGMDFAETISDHLRHGRYSELLTDVGVVLAAGSVLLLVVTPTIIGEAGRLVLIAVFGVLLVVLGKSFKAKTEGLRAWWGREWFRGKKSPKLPPPPELPEPPPPVEDPAMRNAKVMLLLHRGKSRYFIYRQFHMSYRTISNACQRLQRRGMLTKEEDQFVLTDKGKEYVKKYLSGEVLDG